MDIGKIEFGPLTKDHLAGVADASSKIARSLIAERDAAQRELAAYKHVMDILRDSPCKYPPWRDAREVVEWIERSVAVRLAANAGVTGA